jgi:tetratricopeptide (TPR) repeat protein
MIMNGISPLVTSFLCIALLAGCSKTEERGSSSFSSAAQQGAAPEQTQLPNYAGLIEEYRTVLADDPGNFAALVALGNTYYDSGEWKKAVMVYERALRIDPANADVRTDSGTAYRNLGRLEKALAEYQTALKYDPSHLNARYNMGIVYAYDKKDFNAAIHIWEELLKLAPDYPQAEYVRSSITAFKHERVKNIR